MIDDFGLLKLSVGGVNRRVRGAGLIGGRWRCRD